MRIHTGVKGQIENRGGEVEGARPGNEATFQSCRVSISKCALCHDHTHWFCTQQVYACIHTEMYMYIQ